MSPFEPSQPLGTFESFLLFMAQLALTQTGLTQRIASNEFASASRRAPTLLMHNFLATLVLEKVRVLTFDIGVEVYIMTSPLLPGKLLQSVVMIRNRQGEHCKLRTPMSVVGSAKRMIMSFFKLARNYILVF